MAERDIVVLVEEASAAEIVRAICARLGLTERIKILNHEGAGNLKRSISNKLANDPFPSTKFLVLCDADQNDCLKLKRDLLEKVPEGKRNVTIIRIVCQELEAWYLAQSEALKKSNSMAKRLSKNVTSKNPDALKNPKQVFRRHAHEKGQVAHARAIGPHIDPDYTKSASFRHFIVALRKLGDAAT